MKREEEKGGRIASNYHDLMAPDNFQVETLGLVC